MEEWRRGRSMRRAAEYLKSVLFCLFENTFQEIAKRRREKIIFFEKSETIGTKIALL